MPKDWTPEELRNIQGKGGAGMGLGPRAQGRLQWELPLTHLYQFPTPNLGVYVPLAAYQLPKQDGVYILTV